LAHIKFGNISAFAAVVQRSWREVRNKTEGTFSESIQSVFAFSCSALVIRERLACVNNLAI